MNDMQLFLFELECLRRIAKGEGTKLDYELFPPTLGFYDYIYNLELTHERLL